MNYFLDTNICIYYLKGMFPKIKDTLLEKSPSQIKIPSIVRAELLFGAKKSKKMAENINKILSFLEPFETVSFDASMADHYAKIRFDLESKGKTIGPNDLIIAASVMAHESVLVTNNTGEFSRIQDLNLADWTK